VLGMVAIFTYGFRKSEEQFTSEGCDLSTLSNYNTLIECAVRSGYIGDTEIHTLKQWRTDPSVWGTEN
jgi:orotate phosphoribosyltransferase